MIGYVERFTIEKGIHMIKKRMIAGVVALTAIFVMTKGMDVGNAEGQIPGQTEFPISTVAIGSGTMSNTKTAVSLTEDPSAAPDTTPTATATVTPSVKPTVTPSPKASIRPTTTPNKQKKEKKGWNKVSSKKKYYINSKGKRLKGYHKIKGSYYYFSKKTSYAVRNTWKYVSIKGKKYKVYFGKSGKQVADPSKILGKNARYRIYVSLQDNMVMIYAKDGAKGYTIPVKAMICSVGMPGHGTRTGTYSLSRAGAWHVLRYNSNGQYATRYSGPYLFHSVTYDRLGDKYSLQKKEFNKLGKAASHGCIRLQVADAKWIYDHAYQCTATIQNKVSKGPFRKPKAAKIKKSSRGYYDPTDISIKG